jgi:glycosyltransferase involved in cell wall biosynthesis
MMNHTARALELQTRWMIKTIAWSMNRHRPSEKKDIWIFGSRRSGSTLLMQVIAVNPGIKFCNQPLAIRSAGQYDLKLLETLENGPIVELSPEGKEQVELYLREIISGRLHLNEAWNPLSNEFKFSSDRIVFKATDAFALADWIEDSLHANVVALVRHPLAQAWSSMKAGWGPRYLPYLRSPRFVERHLTRDALGACNRIHEDGSILERHVLTWCVENVGLLRSERRRNRRAFIPYEEFIRNTDSAIESLSQAYGLPSISQMARAARTPSLSTRLSDAKSRNAIKQGKKLELLINWREHISSNEAQTAIDVLKLFDIDLYRTDDPFPQEGMSFPRSSDVALGALSKNQIQSIAKTASDDKQKSASSKPNAGSRGTLIFEPEFVGHRAHYINVIAAAARESRSPEPLIFVLHPEILKRLQPATVDYLKGSEGRVTLRVLTDTEARACAKRYFDFQTSVARWNLAVRLGAEFGARAIKFLLLDDIIKAACVSPTTSFEISGIYFRPSMHYPEYRRDLRGKIRQSLKSITFDRILARRDISEVLTFDPYFTAVASQRYRFGKKVQTLAEPFDKPHRMIERTNRRGAVQYLLFGALQARKGIRELLAALHLIDAGVRNNAEFVICGEGDLAPLIEEELPRLSAEGVTIRFIRGFLSQAQLDEELENSDVILAPYRDHIGSSGVIYQAASIRKPVIAPNTGLVGRQVAEYNLGITIDPASAVDLARAITTMTERVRGTEMIAPDPEGFGRFVATAGTLPFAERVLGLTVTQSEKELRVSHG